MTILVDTSILIDHLRGNIDARQALSRSVEIGRPLLCSVVTRVEVLAGMRPREEAVTRALLSSVEWVAVDEAVAEHAGLLANQYLRSHPGVDPVAFIIAATTINREAELWTRNIKQFPMFPELDPPY